MIIEVRGGGEGKKDPLTSFSTLTFANAGISPKKLLTFNFKPLTKQLENFKTIPRSSLKLLKLHHDHILRKRFPSQILIKLKL